MISIIISTYRPSFLRDLQNNISQTVGFLYEIILIENSNQKGICKAYNEGANKAKFSFVCFVHEDVKFLTNNWGPPLVKKFLSDTSVGLIGVAGSKYKSLSPGKGWYSGREELDRFNIIQHAKTDVPPEEHNQMQKDFEKVVCLDGVFLFTTKKIWENNKFDELTFQDFHCYDLDFSLQINRSYKVYVTNKVLLEHFSAGSLNKRWLSETLKLTKKWRKELPVGNANKQIQQELEWNNKIWFLVEMIKYNYPLLQLLRVFLNFGFLKFFSLNKSLKTAKLLFTLLIKRRNA